MKRIANKLIRDEQGQAMILVILLLLVGALIITPLLGFMGTGLMAGQTNETKMAEFYAADAGVENALWKLENDPPSLADYPYSLPMPNVNSESVTVTIDDIGGSTYKITSTAGGTTIIVYVAIVLGLIEGDFNATVDIDDQNVIATGDITLGDGVEIEGGDLIFAGGNLILGNGSEIEDANIWVGGDLILGDGSEIRDGSVICVGGNLIVGDARIRHTDIYVGTMVWDEGLEIFVYVPGNVTLDNGARVESNVYTDGTIDNPDRISGEIYDYEDCPFSVSFNNEIITWDTN